MSKKDATILSNVINHWKNVKADDPVNHKSRLTQAGNIVVCFEELVNGDNSSITSLLFKHDINSRLNDQSNEKNQNSKNSENCCFWRSQQRALFNNHKLKRQKGFISPMIMSTVCVKHFEPQGNFYRFPYLHSIKARYLIFSAS